MGDGVKQTKLLTGRNFIMKSSNAHDRPRFAGSDCLSSEREGRVSSDKDGQNLDTIRSYLRVVRFQKAISGEK